MEKTRTLMIVLLFVVGVNALFAGYSFMAEPSGSGVKASLSLLRYSPFKDFFIPGLILFIVNGILNIVAGIVLIRRWRVSCFLLVAQGILLTSWIVIQVLVTREFNVLHAVFSGLGISFCLGGIYLQKKEALGN